MRYIGNLVWLITSLGAIHLGLIGIGYDIFKMPIFQTTLNFVIIPTHWVIGICGVASLVMYFMSIMGMKCPGCGCEMSKCS